MNRQERKRFRALFEPRGIILAGASSHPAKFGFTALHNLLTCGYRGSVLVTNRHGERILGVQSARKVSELPAGTADLALICTPAEANGAVLEACAGRGVKAAYVASGGYRETGTAGGQAEAALVALADDLGVMLAGPNGQGLVSAPVSLCAQIAPPCPPPGPISIASQSGNLMSSFMNYCRATGIGVARAVGAGNAAAVSVGDYLEWFADDGATRVALTYIEDLTDGRAFSEQVRYVSDRKPLVILKGGVTSEGQRAAASHTGALATADRVFDGAIRQAGGCRVGTVEEAIELAATFATQPLPGGPNTVVVTPVGGWGVLAADAISSSALTLLPLPADLREAIDGMLPARWSGANPIDMAGGETRDTIPEILELVASHPEVHAVIYMGLGIQSNTARLFRDGSFYPEHGLDRIVAYHERQDARFAEAAAAVAGASRKPVLVATELAATDPGNPGPVAVRASGRLCYPSVHRAVRALDRLWWYARWRARRDTISPSAGVV